MTWELTETAQPLKTLPHAQAGCVWEVHFPRLEVKDKAGQGHDEKVLGGRLCFSEKSKATELSLSSLLERQGSSRDRRPAAKAGRGHGVRGVSLASWGPMPLPLPSLGDFMSPEEAPFLWPLRFPGSRYSCAPNQPLETELKNLLCKPPPG